VLLATILTVSGCATYGPQWITLIDGNNGLENFDRIGDANWRAQDGAIVGDKGKGGYLVSKHSYTDFELRAEFWADHTTNSGIFLRASDPRTVSPASAYEVNIFDRRPDPKYGTGAIVDFATVPVPAIYAAGGKWNTYEIYSKGPELTVKFNGQVTVSLRNSEFSSGPFLLQFGSGPNDAPGGAIKWRHVSIRPL
jgi:hypothetical protein